MFVKSPQGNSPEDQLLVQFQGMIAEYERAQILERSRRGKRHRAHAGEVNVMSGAPYGYRYIPKTDEALAAYLVDEAEASVVRRVFEMYTVDGLSIAEISRKLNREGIPPRKASRWERSVVWGILRNPAYRGVACFGKTRLSARTQKRPQRRRGVTTHTAGHHLKSCLADGYPFVFGFVVYESFEKNKKGTWKTGIMPIRIGSMSSQKADMLLWPSGTTTAERLR